MSKLFNNIQETIGDTPIIKLNKLGSSYSPNLYVKCEFFNPGSSIKDRVGKHIIDSAEERGDIKPGGTIVEATSGNTGMGLAIAAAVKGYKCIFTIPDKMSQEKIDNLKAFGAEVQICPTNVEADSPESYYSVAKRLSEETPNAFYANQYHNPDNPETHYRYTGPEIWEQTGGKIDVFIAGVGTGGTISGIGKYLKEKNPEIKIVGIDPVGSILAHYHATGEMCEAKPYKTEGIGEDIIPSNVNFDVIDEFIIVEDKESAVMTRELLLEEGIYAGNSSGAAVCGALKWAEKQSQELLTVIMLPDSGSRYISKVYNDDWMRKEGFLEN
jgi:cystathionine beta-synthase